MEKETIRFLIIIYQYLVCQLIVIEINNEDIYSINYNKKIILFMNKNREDLFDSEE